MIAAYRKIKEDEPCTLFHTFQCLLLFLRDLRGFVLRELLQQRRYYKIDKLFIEKKGCSAKKTNQKQDATSRKRR